MDHWGNVPTDKEIHEREERERKYQQEKNMEEKKKQEEEKKSLKELVDFNRNEYNNDTDKTKFIDFHNLSQDFERPINTHEYNIDYYVKGLLKNELFWIGKNTSYYLKGNEKPKKFDLYKYIKRQRKYDVYYNYFKKIDENNNIEQDSLVIENSEITSNTDPKELNRSYSIIMYPKNNDDNKYDKYFFNLPQNTESNQGPGLATRAFNILKKKPLKKSKAGKKYRKSKKTPKTKK